MRTILPAPAERLIFARIGGAPGPSVALDDRKAVCMPQLLTLVTIGPQARAVAAGNGSWWSPWTRTTYPRVSRRGDHLHARQLKRSPYALSKNAENLTARQERKLAWIQRVNQRLFRTHLLKEHLRLVFQLPFMEAVKLFEQWMQ